MEFVQINKNNTTSCFWTYRSVVFFDARSRVKEDFKDTKAILRDVFSEAARQEGASGLSGSAFCTPTRSLGQRVRHAFCQRLSMLLMNICLTLFLVSYFIGPI
jgi:hypothetical protein